ncbi:integrase [Aeromicrobium sp. Root495]|uniref:tyrosine-type recombinase/integrase n=1 Tax=Aeromicrobium sp. Root495 TaxID=1736550 RepID=UPI0006F2D812|nr:site-specific integrase [Aeromicrobium sp. Root495]KQY55302.1 integrase [Aeromicrobium sp. Root495]
MSPRNPNLASTVYLGADGYWHGRITVGVRDDGKPDRRHVSAKSKANAVRKVRALERLREQARVPNAGSKWTVESWLRYWLDAIVRPGLRDSTFQAYRTAVHKHLVPAVGAHRLERLTPEHLETLYRRMVDGGARPATAHQVHRTVRAALSEAVRRGHVARNVAQLARAPRIVPEPVEPLSVAEVQQLLATAREARNGARWALALALGLRQGEALGLRWSDVDLETRSLRIRSTRLRPSYEHGCGGTCGKTPGRCPERVQRNDLIGPTKSVAGYRVIGLPAALVGLLEQHRAVQTSERRRAGERWVDEGWLFASEIGEALSLNTDYVAWRALLKEAGVRRVRLHDARHTAATVLLVLGVPERTVMSVMGWSSTSMVARYQHVTDPIRREVADRVDALLFDADNSIND